MNIQRAVLRVQLHAAAKLELDRVASHYGMTQIEILSRLFEWIVEQSDVVQLEALGILPPELLAPLAKRALSQAAESEISASPAHDAPAHDARGPESRVETVVDQGMTLHV